MMWEGKVTNNKMKGQENKEGEEEREEKKHDGNLKYHLHRSRRNIREEEEKEMIRNEMKRVGNCSWKPREERERRR
jgi:hypothetical protein